MKNFRLNSSMSGAIPLITGILAIFYAYFIFTSKTNINYYWVIDLLVLLLLIYFIFQYKDNILFIAALIWLVCNYLLRLKTNSQIWKGYDGFTLAVLLTTLY